MAISNSGSSLSTAAVAGTAAAVAVSALLLIFICTLVLAITLVKAQQRDKRALVKTPSAVIYEEVTDTLYKEMQGNEVNLPT